MFVGLLVAWSIGVFVGWLVALLICWSVGLLINCSNSWPVCQKDWVLHLSTITLSSKDRGTAIRRLQFITIGGCENGKQISLSNI